MFEFPFSFLSDSQINDMFHITKPIIDLDTISSMKYSLPLIEIEDHERFLENDQNLYDNTLNELNTDCKYYNLNDVKDTVNSTNTDISVLFHNIRSVPKNFDNFSVSLEGHNFDILALCESRLVENVESLYNISNYNLVTNNRNSQGGGVLLYIHDRIKFEVVHEISLINDYIESLFIKVKTNDRDKLVGVIYHRPQSNFDNFMSSFINILTFIQNSKLICYLTGDFNFDLLKYESNNIVKSFVNQLYDHCFFPSILNPTRVSQSSATLIDNIWNNDIVGNYTSGIVLSDISDHYIVFLLSKNDSFSDSSINRTIEYRDYLHTSQDDFKGLLNAKLSEIVYTNDENVNLANLIKTFQDCTNIAFPLKTKTINSKLIKNPWCSQYLRNLIKQKNALYQKYLKKPITYGGQYRHLRNRVNNLVHNCKNNYYKEKLTLCQNKSKETWAVLNEMLSRTKKSKTVDEILVNGTKITNYEDIANHFNNFYVNVGPELANNIPVSNKSHLDYMTGSYQSSFYLKPVTNSEIISIIKDLKDSASGSDSISTKMLKISSEVVAPILCQIINNCFAAGLFPDCIKIAKVIPVFKGGNHSLITNYRPISILSCIHKIFERALCSRFLDFFTKNDVISVSQFGFRQDHSPTNAIAKFIQQIIDSMESGNYCVGIFLDLSKAFDTLDQNILIDKLQYYGVRGNAIDIVRSYFNDRKQFVVNHVNSDIMNTTCGVPQGSILGPLFFLIYINDIVNSSRLLNFTLFADDTNILYSDSNSDQLFDTLNLELNKVSQWLRVNKLSLNLDKTKYIVFYKRNKISFHQQVIINDVRIAQANEVKFLGVIVDDHLSWRSHIDSIVLKLSKLIGILYKLKNSLTTQSLLLLYYSLAYPHLQYCIAIWGSAPSYLLNKIILKQKRLIRIINKTDRLSHTSPLFKTCKVLKFNDIYKLELTKFMFNEINVKSFLTIPLVLNFIIITLDQGI